MTSVLQLQPNSLPPPTTFGLPGKFSTWRPYQSAATEEVHDSPTRVSIQVQPTGSGKSVCYMTQAALNRGRTLILTSTKALQSQLLGDFADSAFNLQDIRGKNAYRCLIANDDRTHCNEGPCHFGFTCRLRRNGCLFYEQLAKARAADVVVTNYAFWIVNKPGILGEFSLLVCDEAHDTVQHLLDCLGTKLLRKDVKKIHRWPGQEENLWDWVTGLLSEVEHAVEAAKARGGMLAGSAWASALRRMQMAMDRLKRSGDDWVAEYLGDEIIFDPVWPAGLAEPYLFRGIPKVLLTSATVNAKSADLLGLTGEEFEFSEWPSCFPKERRPVIWVPTTRVDHRIKNEGMRAWCTRIDQIIRPRLDRKGIVHTVSYDRRTRVLNSTEFREHVETHNPRNTWEVVRRFKRATPPAILVSPSVVTGWDFPYDTCRYQVIGKVPFPDQRRKVDQARKAIDPEWGMYLTMMQLVQAVGRGMRAPDDMCETFIIDDHWSWFGWKYKHLAPKWFVEVCGKRATLPQPIRL